MKLKFPTGWLYWIFLSIVVLLTATSNANAQSPSACGCGDKFDLINELNKANAALNTLRQAEANFKQGQKPDLTGLQSSVKDAMAGVEDKQARTGSGTIDTATCKSSVDAVSPCLRSVIEKRERNRALHCSMFKSADSKNNGYNDYLRHEQMVFGDEVEDILRRLGDLDRGCLPSDWFGTITITDLKRTVSDETYPAIDKMNRGGEMHQVAETFRRGAIRFRSEGVGYATWSVTDKLTKTDTRTSMHDCDSTPLKESLVGYSNGTHEEFTRTGSRPITLDISPEISEDGRSFEVIFRIPEISVRGQYSKMDKATGGCPGEEYNKPQSGNTGEGAVSTEDIRFKGSVFAGVPQKLSGSTEINLMPLGIVVEGMSIVHTAHVSYNLYRFR